MPDEQERGSAKRPRKTATGIERTRQAQRAPRRPSSGDDHDPRQPVDFQVAAQRLTARAAQITRLKAEVEGGAYNADPTETARAMERRSDA